MSQNHIHSDQPVLSRVSIDISLMIRGNKVNVPVSQIKWVSGQFNYSCYHGVDGSENWMARTIRLVSGQVGPEFIRIHKQYLVNSTYIASVDLLHRTVRMQCGEALPVSRRRIGGLRAELAKWIKPVSKIALPPRITLV